MNKHLENFNNLFSLDQNIVYKALLAKKDLINGFFYSDYDFSMHLENGKEIYDDLFSLLNKSLLLKTDKSDNFAYRYFNKDKKCLKKEGHFLVGYDFTKLETAPYKELFANFYPCIDEKDKVTFDEPIMNELLDMMISKNEYVLILDKTNLINNAYPINVIKEIIYDKNYIDDLKLEALKEIATSLDITLKEETYE